MFTFCPNKQGSGTWTDLTITGAQGGAQPVCEQHWRERSFLIHVIQRWTWDLVSGA